MSNAIKFSDDERISGIKTLNQGVKTGTLGSRAGKLLVNGFIIGLWITNIKK